MVAEPRSKSSPRAAHSREIRPQPPTKIEILSFEVANVMSKTVHLHKSLSSNEISKLKHQTLKSIGVRTLVSSDETHLLDLALSEKLDDLSFIAGVVSRLGKKSTVPQLQGFQHVYGDVVAGAIDVNELGFLVKDMDSMVRKMERFVNSTTTLYREMEILNELEVALKKFPQIHLEESRKFFDQKLSWQRQDVRHLKRVSLWNQTFDKTVEMLVRTVCTLYARIHVVFGDSIAFSSSRSHSSRSLAPKSRQIDVGSIANPQIGSRKWETSLDFNFACGLGPGRLFMECLNLTTPLSKLDDSDRISQVPVSHSGFRPPPATVGGSALALHYANVIIVIQKLLQYPHLIGDEARDDLYRMLPASLKLALKTRLKSYVRNTSIFDATVAHDWKERLDGVLSWLAPLAHDMIRWHSDRSFEQQPMVSRTNVLLLQTLYFADRGKTEAAVCELLVGLTYICRFEQQQNALLDCTSSFDFDEWEPERLDL